MNIAAAEFDARIARVELLGRLVEEVGEPRQHFVRRRQVGSFMISK